MQLTSNIKEEWNIEPDSVLKRACHRWHRDIHMTLSEQNKLKEVPDSACIIQMELTSILDTEQYQIEVGGNTILIRAGDNLGMIYALLYLSEAFLGISPFWYWNDQGFVRRPWVEVPEGRYCSQPYRMRYRGWFINDEVLLDAWGKEYYDESTGIVENEAFEMAMETLLRLGGNMVIPGTDRNSHKYKKLAADMGLWITHHHAEPLGAEMFSRKYPDLTPSYRQYPELFHALWREAIEEQKDNNVIWNIGFRGQGDRPFWVDDPIYDTPVKRGELISSLILKQYEMLQEYMESPVCCTNLYGEVMELYKQGYITLPEDIIYIWADNGYGKMVSRRQGNHNPRTVALPPEPKGHHGIYYHASFYDLQAASHITMLPNSTEFVKGELESAMEKGVRELLLINCSNVRPHTYMLDAIARIWGKREDKTYTQMYFPGAARQVQEVYESYFRSMLQYGPNEDDHAGEQYYHYTMRAVCHGWLLGKFREAEEDLVWLTGGKTLTEQVEWIKGKAEEALPTMERHYSLCRELADMLKDEGMEEEFGLFLDGPMLQAVIHYKSLLAQEMMCEAYKCMIDGKNYEDAFVKIGDTIICLRDILQAMTEAGHGKWRGFYDNDCLTDVKYTAYMLEKVMGYIRNRGDGPHYYQWALKYMYSEAEHRVVLITNMRNHPKDWELYEAMREKRQRQNL